MEITISKHAAKRAAELGISEEGIRAIVAGLGDTMAFSCTPPLNEHGQSMTDEELGEYYDTYSTVPDIIEAEKNGEIFWSTPGGESAYEKLKRHMEAKEARTAVAAMA